MHRKKKRERRPPSHDPRFAKKSSFERTEQKKRIKKVSNSDPLKTGDIYAPIKLGKGRGLQKKNLHTDCLAEGLASGAAGEDRRGVLWGDGGGGGGFEK